MYRCSMVRCPGQDQRFWKPEDIFEVACPGCEKKIEFFKDEPQLKCKNCERMVLNPKLNPGCTKWCKYAKECLGIVKSGDRDREAKGV